VAYSTDPQSDISALTVEELVLFLREATQEGASIYCEEIIRRFEPLLRQAWRKSGFKDEYQDFLHDVLVRLFRALPHLENPKAFPGYFRRVVLSVVVDYSRRGLPASVQSLDEADEVVDRVDQKILAGVFVRSYLEHLPPRERDVLTLATLHELADEKIAEQLGITRGAVRTTKARALNRLRKLLVAEAGALDEKSAGS
jgi:RNA polymerase sigma factor (sigma-70 family)